MHTDIRTNDRTTDCARSNATTPRRLTVARLICAAGGLALLAGCGSQTAPAAGVPVPHATIKPATPPASGSAFDHEHQRLSRLAPTATNPTFDHEHQRLSRLAPTATNPTFDHEHQRLSRLAPPATAQRPAYLILQEEIDWWLAERDEARISTGD
jgi:hypothetical protein